MRFPVRHIFAFLAAGALLTGCASSNPYQGMNLQAVYEEGLEHMEEEEWDEAIEAFETVVFGAGGSPEAAPARYHLGRAFFEKGEYVTASSEFERFLEFYPSHELAPDAALARCRSLAELSPIIQRDQQETRQAYRACSNAASDFAGTDAALEAAEIRDRMWEKLAEKVYVGGEFYFERDLYDSALIYYEDVVQNYPGTRAAPRALRRMYQAYQEIGYEEEAEDARERLLQEYPDSDAAQQFQERTSSRG